MATMIKKKTNPAAAIATGCRLLVDAVDMRDYPVIQASVLLFSLEFIVINLVVDVLYGWIQSVKVRKPVNS